MFVSASGLLPVVHSTVLVPHSQRKEVLSAPVSTAFSFCSCCTHCVRSVCSCSSGCSHCSACDPVSWWWYSFAVFIVKYCIVYCFDL